MRRRIISVVLAVLLTGGQLGAVEDEDISAADEGYSYGSQAGWGFAAVGTNLLYMPAKLTYVVVATVTGGLVYALTLGNSRAVHAIFSPALGGTYVISPAMLKGDEPVFFFGETVQD
jgi:hypothetical protein